MFRSMKDFTKGNDTDFQVIDLHCDSHGAEYQKRSIIYVVSKLLSNGVNPTTIFVLIEWSQPNRLFTEIPKEICSKILIGNTSEGTFILDNKFSLKEYSSEYIMKYKSLNVIFGDRIYTNPDVDDLSYFENDDIEWYLRQYKDNCHISHKPIDRFENYLQNILDTQSYLTSNGIDNLSFLMNNTFEGYDTDFSHIYPSNVDMVSSEDIRIPNSKNGFHIKDFSSYLNQIWNQIDFTKFVFYENDVCKYGGIDEYTMDKFGHIAYTSAANSWDIPEDGYVTSFGTHPHDSVYIDFFQDYIYNNITKYIGEFKFDMTNRWDSSKHNSIRK